MSISLVKKKAAVKKINNAPVVVDPVDELFDGAESIDLSIEKIELYESGVCIDLGVEDIELYEEVKPTKKIKRMPKKITVESPRKSASFYEQLKTIKTADQKDSFGFLEYYQRQQQRKRKGGQNPAVKRSVKKKSTANSDHSEIPFHLEEDSLPYGYELDSRGRICKLTGKNSDILTPIAEQPVKMVATASDVDGNNLTKVIQFPDLNGKVKEQIIRDEDWYDKNSVIERKLASRGLEILNKKLFKGYLNDTEVSDHQLMVDCMGWIHEQGSMVFITPNDIVGDTEGQGIIRNFNSPEEIGMWEKKGTLRDWQENTLKHAAEFSPALFAILVAFASPLSSFLEINSGGFHLYGMSSGGKSSSLKAGATVFGRPAGSGRNKNSFLKTWHVTGNALDPLLVSRCNCLLALDELGMFNGNLSEVIYKIESGEGKKRSNIDGGLQNTAYWDTTVISAGEVSLKETLEKQKQYKEGTRVRLLDINFDKIVESLNTSKDNQYFSELSKHCNDFHGTAGIEFVRALIKHYGIYSNAERELIQLFTECCDELLRDRDYTNFQGRGLERLALVYFAGKLAHNYGIISTIPLEKIKQVVVTAMDVWLDSKDLASEGELGAEKLAGYLRMNAHAMKGIAITTFCVGNQTAGYIYQGQFFIISDALKKILGTVNLNKTMHFLKEHNLLTTPESGTRLQMRKTLPGRPQKEYFYVVSQDICEMSFE